MFFDPPGNGGMATPQKTLEAFVAALNRRDPPALRALVQGSKYVPALEEDVTHDSLMPIRYAVRQITVKPISPTRVTVSFVLNRVLTGSQLKSTSPEKLDMVKAGDVWRIVAPPIGTKPPPGYLASQAMILVEPKLVKLTLTVTKAERARLNLKEIAIGALMHIEDDKGMILLKPEDYPKALYTYIRIPGVYTSPLDKPRTISYAFNSNLTGRKVSSIKDPKNTVMFFEGKPEALNFRYDGEALVALVDGSARFVTPAEAKLLQWR